MPVLDLTIPVATLGELKAHLRLEDEHEDALLAGWLRAATEAVETELGLLLLERPVVETLPLMHGAARLSRRPVRLIERVEEQRQGDWHSLAAEDFRLDSGGGQSATLYIAAAGSSAGTVRVRYRAGMALSKNDVSELVRNAVIRLAAFWHGNRDAAEAPAIPSSVRQMLAPLRAKRLR